MNIAIILAGGNGNRMQTKDIPKQFLLVAGKPIVIYTVEKFEASDKIDKIVLVCKDGYEEQLRSYVEQFRLKKVSSIVIGGDTRQDSLYQGVVAAAGLSDNPKEDIVLIHDAVRPAVSLELIAKTIEMAKQHKAVISVGRPFETIMIIGDDGFVKEVKNRNICRTGKAPHAYNLKLLASIFEKSRADGKLNYIDDESMMYDYGIPLFTVECSDANIKITNRMDYIVFRSFIWTLEDSQFEDENI